MADPFANLLDSFKTAPSKSAKATTENKPIKINASTSSIASSSASRSQVLPKTNNLKGPQHPSFLFENNSSASVLQPTRKSSSPVNTPTSVVSPASTPRVLSNSRVTSAFDDDWSDLFGSNNSTPSANTVSVHRTNTFQKNVHGTNTPQESLASVDSSTTSQKQDSEEIVDEVVDMEIAKIMSLGYSFERAVQHLNMGDTYESIILKKKQTKEAKQRSERAKIASQQRDSSVDIFSFANNILEKGKSFLNENLQFDQDRYSQNGFSTGQNESYVKPDRLAAFNSNFGHSVKNSLNEDNPFEQRHDLKKQPQQRHRPASTDTHIEHDLLDLDIDNNTAKPMPAPSAHSSTTSLENQSSLLDISSAVPSISTTHASPSASASPVLDLGISAPSTAVPISELEYSSYLDFKAKGHALSKNGNFPDALNNYEKALHSLPETHPLRVIALSNIITSLFKIGEFNNALQNIEDALILFPKTDLNAIIPKDENDKKFKDIWWKIVLKKAEILEQQEKFEQSLALYKDLISKGFTTKKIIDAKQRCDKVVNPVQRKTPIPSAKKPEAKSASTSPKLVKAANTSQSKAKNLDDEKFKLHDQVQGQISAWSAGHESDLRYLLANLHAVLKFGNWKSVNPQDLIIPRKCKIVYLKAVAKTHPDKINTKTVSLENQMLASNIFMVLTKAWESFKIENSIS
ncbi:hypothetical protein ACO0QE_000507 [Hanseniaspora vineae]